MAFVRTKNEAVGLGLTRAHNLSVRWAWISYVGLFFNIETLQHYISLSLRITHHTKFKPHTFSFQVGSLSLCLSNSVVPLLSSLSLSLSLQGTTRVTITQKALLVLGSGFSSILVIWRYVWVLVMFRLHNWLLLPPFISECFQLSCHPSTIYIVDL